MKNSDEINNKIKGILDSLDLSEITLPDWHTHTKIDLDSPDNVISFESLKQKRMEREINNSSNVIQVDFVNKKVIG